MYDTSCARFASGMSVALKSGLDTEEGFDLVTQLVDDPDFCQKIASAREAIQNGEDFSDALNKAGIFSGIDARMVSVGFRAGAADSALSDIASRLQTETDEKLQSLAGLLEPTLVAVLSVLVGLILLSVMLPLVNVMSNIGEGLSGKEGYCYESISEKTGIFSKPADPACFHLNFPADFSSVL